MGLFAFLHFIADIIHLLTVAKITACWAQDSHLNSFVRLMKYRYFDFFHRQQFYMEQSVMSALNIYFL